MSSSVRSRKSKASSLKSKKQHQEQLQQQETRKSVSQGRAPSVAPPPTSVLTEEWEGLPRYPNFTSVMGCLRALDYLGTCAFAVSGSLLACTYGMNAFGCVVIGTISSFGGGIIRGILFNSLPPPFIEEYERLMVAMAFSLFTFMFALVFVPNDQHMATFQSLMFWLDTFALGSSCVSATMHGSRSGYPLVLTLLNTVLSGTGGGVIRDVLIRRPIRILNSFDEAYAEVLLVGACVYLCMKKVSVPLPVRAALGWACVVFVRWYVMTNELSLPTATAFRSKYQAPSN